jgi:hypothetical protein
MPARPRPERHLLQVSGGRHLRAATGGTPPVGGRTMAAWPRPGGTFSRRQAPAGGAPAGYGPTARSPAGGQLTPGRTPAGAFSQVSAGGIRTCGLRTGGTLAGE